MLDLRVGRDQGGGEGEVVGRGKGGEERCGEEAEARWCGVWG